MSTQRSDHDERANGVPRKPYQKPRLEVYGNIRELTGHVGNASPVVDAPPHAGYKYTTR